MDSKKKQVPITYNHTPYLALASEPADTMFAGRTYVGLCTAPFAKRRVFRRIRRELRARA
ncbi:hypothetical protein EYC59_06255 [Candidatus Saccharibacteria bacterium]|nr:MAG: hypothetical protein EYC59_06255 [Candidatus Saccharibacteria bacterium]